MSKKNCFLLITCISLSGCSTVVSEYISSQESFGYEHIASNEELVKQGFTKSNYCSNQNQACMSYLSAEPFIDKQKLNYNVSIKASGNNEVLQLKLERKNVKLYLGEVVLIHGFRASKEFMVNSALYFRFLGFKVLIPDLLGHGESNSKISFGVKDSQILDELLSQRSNIRYPLFFVGNSMGAVSAAHLAAIRSDVSGLILLAPMMMFDEAAVNYINSYSPLISVFISDQVIRDGAIKALNNADVSLDQTDIKPIISSLKIPTLILVSSSDPVAPFSYFKFPQGRNITVVDVGNRSHPGMAVISNNDNEHIQKWLNSNAILELE